MNISLPESMQTYVEEQVKIGGYGTASEYIRDLISQDQQRKAQEHLEVLLVEGLDSGTATQMTKQDWTDIRKSVQKKVAERRTQES